MNFLVDTNLASEPIKPRPNPRVLAWAKANRTRLYVSTITIAEIRRGIERLPEGRRKTACKLWFTKLCKDTKYRTISFNASAAHVWGQLAAKWERAGVTVPDLDGFIAAIAIRHNLALVTRNVSDFQNTGLRVINPFDDSE